MNSIIYDIHKNLSGKKEKLRIEYVPSVCIEEFEDIIKSSETEIWN